MVTGFIHDSRVPAQPTIRHGYWFQGTDYHFDWNPDHQRGVPPLPSGLEGSYLTSGHRDGRYRIGVDHDGNRRLFIYRSKDAVVVADSLHGLAVHVREQDYRLTHRPEHLEAWSGRGAFLEQMWSYQTVFTQIDLVPHFMDVVVRFNGQVELIPRDIAPFLTQVNGYEAALRSYLLIWLGRMRTLASDDNVAVTTDLSGGLDSRTSFSLTAHLVTALPSLRDRVSIYCNPKGQHPKDYSAGSGIVEELDLRLTHRRRERDFRRPANLATRFAAWQANRLGQYVLATDLPRCAPDPSAASISGLGGEKYRKYFHNHADDLEGLALQKRRFFDDKALYQPFRDSILESSQVARQDAVAGPDDLFVHYRAFRQRFHLGCPSVENVKFAPLSGPWMDRLAIHAGQERLESGQVLFDIISSMDERLLDLEFDESSKGPTARHREDLCRVAVEVPPAGQVFVHRPPDRQQSSDSNQQTATGISLFRSEFDRALPRVPASKREVIDRVEEIFGQHEGGGFNNQKHMQGIHSALLYELVADLAPDRDSSAPM